jgi:hypothetical protein
MDIVIKSILEYIQSLPGHTNTVLAGGAPRDVLLGLTPKDYDLVIPSKSPKEIHDLARSIVQEFSVTDMVLKTQDYKNQSLGTGRRKKFSLSIEPVKTHVSKLTCVYGFTFEGKKIDLIGHKEDDDEDFANEVIQGFDYGINMVYDTGSYVYDENSYFSEDLSYGTMTLVNLPSMEELPKAMERYNRLSNRYKETYGQELRFRSTCLELNKPKTTVSDKYDPSIYKKYIMDNTPEVWGQTDGAIGPEPGWTTAAGQAVNFPSAMPAMNPAPAWDQPVTHTEAFLNTVDDEFTTNF